MKRIGVFLAGLLLASIIAGCDSGIPEGPPKEGPMDPQPAAFKDYMKSNAGKMVNKKKPAKPASAPAAAPATTPEKSDTP